MTRRLAPYAVAIAGAIATTAVIGGLSAVASISGLSAFYLLLVLWLGALCLAVGVVSLGGALLRSALVPDEQPTRTPASARQR